MVEPGHDTRQLGQRLCWEPDLRHVCRTCRVSVQVREADGLRRVRVPGAVQCVCVRARARGWHTSWLGSLADVPACAVSLVAYG